MSGCTHGLSLRPENLAMKFKGTAMLNHVEQPWWPKSSRDIEATIRRLNVAGRQNLFVFLVIAAAGAEWKIFSEAMENACDLSRTQVRDLLLKVYASPAWSSAYATARLPPALFTFFITVVRLSRTITRQSPQILSSHRLRVMVIKKALLEADGESRIVHEGLRAQLIA